MSKGFRCAEVSQSFKNDKCKTLLQDMAKMVKELLLSYQTCTDTLPQRIIMYRKFLVTSSTLIRMASSPDDRLSGKASETARISRASLAPCFPCVPLPLKLRAANEAQHCQVTLHLKSCELLRRDDSEEKTCTVRLMQGTVSAKGNSRR